MSDATKTSTPHLIIRQIMYLSVLAIIILIAFFPLTVKVPQKTQITSSAQGMYIFQPATQFGLSYGSPSLYNFSSNELLISTHVVNSTQQNLLLTSLIQVNNTSPTLLQHSAVFMLNLSGNENLQIGSIELTAFIETVNTPGPIQLSWFIVPSQVSSYLSGSQPITVLSTPLIGLGDAVFVNTVGNYTWTMDIHGVDIEGNQKLVMQLTPGNQTSIFDQGTNRYPPASVVSLSAKSTRPPEAEVDFIRTYNPPGEQGFFVWSLYGIATVISLWKKSLAEPLYTLVFIVSALYLAVPILLFRFGEPIGLTFVFVSLVAASYVFWRQNKQRISRHSK